MSLDAPVLEPRARQAKLPLVQRLPLLALNALASLRLTVVLFALSLVLVFTGTLAQMDANIIAVVDNYFWSWGVWIPATVFVRFAQVFLEVSPDTALAESYGFWFPGGFLLGWAMLANLCAAHLLRFRAVQTYREIRKGFAAGQGAKTLLNVVLRRGGIWAIHLGLILLFVGEFGTRTFAIEQRMLIPEGGAVDYTQDAHLTQLAFLTPKPDDAEMERVTVIPQKILRHALADKSRIVDDELPFDVAVEEWFPSSQLVIVDDRFVTEPTPGVTAGLGKDLHLIGIKTTTGVDAQQRVDLPGAIITLYEKGTDTAVGTYAVSTSFERYENLPAIQDIAGSDARMTLRFRRHFKPFEIGLEKFTVEYYPGTKTPKTYASRVTLRDPERNEDFETTISMNEPLRHRGETFFQASFQLEGVDGADHTGTVLQVVKNPVWWLPYAACLTVTFGMLLHFGYFLTQFLVRIARGTPAVGRPVATKRVGGDFKSDRLDSLRAPRPSSRMLLWTGVIVALGAMMYYGGYVRRETPKAALDLSRLASLPMLDGGRVKPIDTPSRVWMRLLTHSESVTVDKKKRPALEWVMELASRPLDAVDKSWALHAEVFRVEDPDVRAMLELERREGYRYSFNEITGSTPKGKSREVILRSAVEKAREAQKAGKTADLVQKATIELARHLEIARGIQSGGLLNVLPPETEGEPLRSTFSLITPRIEELQKRAASIQESAMIVFLQDRFPDAKDGKGLQEAIGALSREDQVELVSAARSFGERAASETMLRGFKETLAADPAANAWTELLAAFRAKDQEKFDVALDQFQELQSPSVSSATRAKAKVEAKLNAVAPFFHVIAGCVFVMLLLAGAWAALFVSPAFSEALRREAVWLLAALFLAQTIALVLRMYLSDRPLVFVTNLYSSAVFIAWGAMFLGLIVERVYALGVGAFVAAALGFTGNIIAHNLADGGSDTIEMQEAVLDSTLWLSTHVTTVTAGYAATFVAGTIGIVYVLLDLAGIMVRQLGGSFNPLKNPTVMGRGAGARELEAGRAVGMLLYGVICFATLLSFVGTVLGGIWADQSWGRFWGWDPKENGAVLIVIWNALILHARWGGLVKDRGIAILAIVGNMITAWSWFGTNQLGVGLHAYGFSKALATGCVAVWGSHLFLISVALGLYAINRVMPPRTA